MKPYLLFTSIFLFLQGLYSQTNDWTEMNLQGKVKSITETTYKVNGTKTKINKQYKGECLIYHFNENGYLTEEIRLEPFDNTLDEKTIYSYDQQNRLLTMKSYRNDTIPNTIHTFVYDAKGVLKSDSISHNGRYTKYVYTFDAKGQLTELTGYGNEGEYFAKYTYEYDSKGNMRIEKWITKDDSLVYTHFNDYNQSNLLIQKKIVYPDSEHRSIVTYKYNENLILIEENFLGPSNNVIDTDLYTLDDQFNWIEKLTIEFNEPLSLKERKIEYFQ